MFKNISKIFGDDEEEIKYLLEDNLFQCEITLPYPARNQQAYHKIIAIIKVYSARSLPVAKNIAILYMKWISEWRLSSSAICGMDILNQWLHHDMIQASRFCPEFKYKEKYYKCVPNQIKMMMYYNNKTFINSKRL